NKTVFESEENLRQFDSNWRKYIFPETRIPDDSKEVPEAMDDLKEFFLDGKPLTFDNFEGFQDMLSDLQTAFSLYYGLEYMPKAKKGNIYVYSFIADQDLNFLKKHFDMNYPGASHADELGYLFHVSFLPNVSSDNPAYLTRQRMVRL
ncbi:Carboxylic ester hydrolase, partial [Gryllus bimaculatus]